MKKRYRQIWANVEERKQKEPENQRKKKNDIAMMKDMTRQKGNYKEDTEQNKKQNKKQKQTIKRRKPVHPIKEMNEKLKYMNKLMRKENLSLDDRDGDWESNCKRQYWQTTNCTRGKHTIVGSNMTEKIKNNKVYYNWPVSQAKHGRVQMLFLKKWKQKLINT